MSKSSDVSLSTGRGYAKQGSNSMIGRAGARAQVATFAEKPKGRDEAVRDGISRAILDKDLELLQEVAGKYYRLADKDIPVTNAELNKIKTSVYGIIRGRLRSAIASNNIATLQAAVKCADESSNRFPYITKKMESMQEYCTATSILAGKIDWEVPQAPHRLDDSSELIKLVGHTLLNAGNHKVDAAEALFGKSAVGIYVSALSTDRRHEEKLIALYNKSLKSRGFEVVFVSLDVTFSNFVACHRRMPWLALPFRNSQGAQRLCSRLGITEQPTLTVLDSTGERVINAEGLLEIHDDPEGEHYPWYAEEGPEHEAPPEPAEDPHDALLHRAPTEGELRHRAPTEGEIQECEVGTRPAATSKGIIEEPVHAVRSTRSTGSARKQLVRTTSFVNPMDEEFMKLFGNKLQTADGEQYTRDVLRGVENVGIFFSCGEDAFGKQFLPILVQAYTSLQLRQKPMGIIFVSCDTSLESFNEYFAQMPWAAIPPSREHIMIGLLTQFGVNTTQFTIIGPGGEEIAHDAVDNIINDRNCESYPWADSDPNCFERKPSERPLLSRKNSIISYRMDDGEGDHDFGEESDNSMF